ncbi:unnamed protein product [Lactuca virosa]|uniref:Uncharacterized protein n=1 Tax=Lactuca virosa TaxID=75947 RepID=A0AAU9MLF2_9ASTR|nr:unnamed protein product [Lactuca virosa]
MFSSHSSISSSSFFETAVAAIEISGNWISFDNKDSKRAAKQITNFSLLLNEDINNQERAETFYAYKYDVRNLSVKLWLVVVHLGHLQGAQWAYLS